MVVLSPWAYGAVDPVFEYGLYAGTGLLAILWGVISALRGRFHWFACPVALSIALIFLLGIVQLVPMPSWLVSVVSPATASLNHELRPTQSEVISPGEAPAASAWVPTISMYPHATRQELYRWLAVLVCFAAVRNVVASTGSLRRLSWITLANGIFLSVFAMYQFFGSAALGGVSRHAVYSFETKGDPFGPFICRNHFPDYINLCIGLGIGLLLVSSRSESDKRASRTHKAQALVEQSEQDETGFSILSFLHSPMQLWLSAGIAIMAVAVLCSMSRGGVAALILGAIVAVVLRGTLPGRRPTRLEFFALPILLIVGFVAWLGINPLQRVTNAQTTFVSDARIKIWKNLLPLTYRFPIFGSGYGTLQYVEPLHRQTDYYGYNATVDIDHAHNDYLEAMVEGGIIRLALTVAIVFFLLNFGRKAMRRHETRTPGRLALGALVGIAALAVHSVVDFGITTPAVACMAAVVAAQLATMARSDPSEPASENSPNMVAFDLGGLGGVVAAVCLVVIAFLLAGQGSTISFVNQRRMAAYQAMHSANRTNWELAATQLQRAVERDRYDAGLRAELGQIFLDAERLLNQDRQKRLQVAAGSGMAATAIEQPLNSLGPASAWDATTTPSPAARRTYVDDFIKPGIHEMIVARDLCPLLARSQSRLAAHAFDAKSPDGFTMAKSDPAAAYWDRAVRLAPYDADLLYFVGLLHLQSNRAEEAWPLWRRSLERAPAHVQEIVTKAIPRVGVDKLLQSVLTDDPGVLLEGARALASDPTQADAQRKMLYRAKEILNGRVEWDGESFHQLAEAHAMLGETDQALSAYKQAIGYSPQIGLWRLQYAKLLYTLQTTAAKQEALEQLDEALHLSPGMTQASDLRERIIQEMPRR
ncbi:MAG: O-antigen ligase family protein [Gemmataceae bacterium]